MTHPRLRGDKLEGRVAGGLATRAGHDGLVRAAGIGEAAEAAQTIGNDFGSGLENTLGNGLDPAFVETLYTPYFRRTGLPSPVVSTAATIGILPGLPRPRLPPR